MPIAKAKLKGQVVVELERWGLGDTAIDPGIVLLRLVTQSAARVDRYSTELQRIVDEAETLKDALVGDSWSVDQEGIARKTGEYIRALTQLEGIERDRCARMAQTAVAAGLAERQVRLAEQQGALLAAVIAEIVTALGHDPRDPRTAAVISGTIQRLTGIEGAA